MMTEVFGRVYSLVSFLGREYFGCGDDLFISVIIVFILSV